MKHIVRIHQKNNIRNIEAEEGTNILRLLRENSIQINATCGGNGTCGKCRARMAGLTNEISDKEKALLGEKALEAGYRLTCYNVVNSDMDIYMDGDKETAKIATEGKNRAFKISPIVSKEMVQLEPADISDQRSDIERVLDAAQKAVSKSKSFDLLNVLKRLPQTIRNDNYQATLVYTEDQLVDIEAGDTKERLYGIAVDIGTTTIAAYLMDLNSGKRVDVYSALNPQRKFGSDVVSRIQYSQESPEAFREIHRVIIDCMNDIISYFEKKNRISKNGIYAVVFVGNTTMMHLLMGLPAENIAVSPFIPVSTLQHKINAAELGITINPQGCAVIFPSVSGYIGADTVAAVLSSGMYSSSKISLLVDIGTNGEIVLGNKDWMISCSAAAGPAFEGAHIRNGVAGIKGAIDKISFKPEFKYTTIGNDKPVGICGSGIVDAVAGMLTAGLMDETGRIVEEDEIDNDSSKSLANRLIDVDGVSALLISPAEENNAGTDVVITQKDIRELQNAKAAIAAGIKTLVKHAGIKMNEIDRVYLAGGFGSYINIESAIQIGLISGELRGRVESIGNAAGAGAIEGILSEKLLAKTQDIKKRIKYIELSASPDFMDEYVESMMFE